MPSGRPTKYTPELLDKAQDYLEHYEDHGDVIPSIVGLSLVLDVCRDTIHTWVKEEGKEKFSYILGMIKAKQEQVLIKKGLTSEFNSNIVKLALGKHGYSDKQDTRLSDPDGKGLAWTINIIEKKE